MRMFAELCILHHLGKGKFHILDGRGNGPVFKRRGGGPEARPSKFHKSAVISNLEVADEPGESF